MQEPRAIEYLLWPGMGSKLWSAEGIMDQSWFYDFSSDFSVLPVAGDLLLRACPEQFPRLNSGLSFPGRQDRGSECPLDSRTPRRHHVLLPCFTWYHHLCPSVILFLPSQSDNFKNKQTILVIAAAVSVSLACGMKTISIWLYISFKSQRFDLTSLAVHISWQNKWDVSQTL